MFVTCLRLYSFFVLINYRCILATLYDDEVYEPTAEYFSDSALYRERFDIYDENCNEVHGLDENYGELKPTREGSQYSCDTLKYEIESAENQTVHLNVQLYLKEETSIFLSIFQIESFANGGHYRNTFDTGYFPHRTPKVFNLTSADSAGYQIILSYRSRLTTMERNLEQNFLKSGEQDVMKEFSAKFSRIDVSDTESYCPRIFHDAREEQQQLAYPTNPYPSMRCFYIISAPEGYVVNFRANSMASFIKFILYEDENYTEYRFYEGIVKKIANITNAPSEVTSRTKSLRIELIFDANADIISSDGLFNVTFNLKESPCKCFDKEYVISSEDETEVLSPGFPRERCGHVHCYSSLRLKGNESDLEHQAIRVELNSLDLETKNDWIHFYERSENSPSHLVSLTGSLNQSRINYFTFTSGKGDLEIESGRLLQKRGFNLSVIAIKGTNGCACNSYSQQVTRLYSNEGALQLFLGSECQFADCFFDIMKPQVSRFMINRNPERELSVNITYSFKGAKEEFLDVISWNKKFSHSADIYRKLKTYCPSEMNKGNASLFHQNHNVRIWYHLATTERTPGDVVLSLAYKWKHKCECGESELHADPGEWKTLSSPNYPSSYCREMRCIYRISAPSDHIVSIILEDCVLTDVSSLKFFNGNDNLSSGKLLDRVWLTKFTGKRQIHSTVNAVTIDFSTSRGEPARGFFFSYTAVLPTPSI